MSGLDSLLRASPPLTLEVGDPAPFFYGVATDGIFYSLMAQAGRSVALVFLPDLEEPGIDGRLQAFIDLSEAYALIGADVIVASPAPPNDVFVFAQALDGRLKVVACEAPVFARCGFDRLGFAVLGLDRNGRVAGLCGAETGSDAAGLMFSALAELPREEPRGLVVQPAPVMVLPNLLPPDLCRRLINRFEIENHFDSGFAGVDQTGQPAYKIDYAKKKREDLLIGEGHEFYGVVTDCLMRRCRPEIKKAFHIDIAFFDRILVARYDVGGHFARHRDNGGANTAFRQFALSVNLNVGEYDGGALYFPEFNDHLHGPPTGGGLIFSGSLIHEATPVTHGSRYVLLTFLHDAASEARRLAYERQASERPA